MKFLAGILLLITTVACHGSDEFLEWLKSSESRPINGYSTRVMELPKKADSRVLVSPSGNAFALSKREHKRRSVFVHSFDVGLPIKIFEAKTEETKLDELDLAWSPNGEELNVQLGFPDSGAGRWFSYDSKTGRLLADAALFEEMYKSDGSSDIWGSNRGNIDPAWVFGAKKFRSRAGAEQAGHSAFYDPAFNLSFYGSKTALPVRFNGSLYQMFCDSRNSSYAYVIENDSLIGKVQLACMPFPEALFVYNGKNLLLKMVWLESRAKVNPRQPDPIEWENRERVESFKLGQRKLENVTSLNGRGYLLQTTDSKSRIWEIINFKKIKAD